MMCGPIHDSLVGSVRGVVCRPHILTQLSDGVIAKNQARLEMLELARMKHPYRTQIWQCCSECNTTPLNPEPLPLETYFSTWLLLVVAKATHIATTAEQWSDSDAPASEARDDEAEEAVTVRLLVREVPHVIRGPNVHCAGCSMQGIRF
eukprot:5950850-Amphidinium_carterae.3